MRLENPSSRRHNERWDQHHHERANIMSDKEIKKPDDCQSRDEVRHEIDRLDLAIVDLLGERWGYVDRMWQLKREAEAAASVPWRNRGQGRA